MKIHLYEWDIIIPRKYVEGTDLVRGVHPVENLARADRDTGGVEQIKRILSPISFEPLLGNGRKRSCGCR